MLVRNCAVRHERIDLRLIVIVYDPWLDQRLGFRIEVSGWLDVGKKY